MSALATEKEKVRIGYFPMNGFCDVASDGTATGYWREYTDAVVSNTGWDCEYVGYASWVEALDALSKGSIDILAPSQRTPEREEQYSFDSFPIGTEYGSLLALGTNGCLVYEDYAAFQGLHVGVVESLVFLDDFTDYEQRNGFSVELSYYKDTPALVAALNAGEVDAIVANLMVKTETMKMLAKFGSAPFYYMLRSGADDLCIELNQAIDRMTTQHPELINELTATYFPSYNDIPLSKQEIDYIASAGTLKVACGANFAPYSYVDEASSEIVGVDRAVIERISQLTGLQFAFEKTPFSENTADYVKNSGISLIAGVEHDQRVLMHDSMFTEPYLTTSKYFIGLSDTTFDSDAEMHIAMVSAADAQITKLQQQYPRFLFKRYSSVADCVKALHGGEADLVLSDRYSMERLLSAPQNENLQFMPAEAVLGSICCKVVSQANPDVLVSILNKAIKQIPASETAQYIDDSLRATRYEYSFADFIYQYRYPIVITAVFLLIGTIALVFVLRAKRKAGQAIEQNEMKLRNITNNINGGVVVLKTDEGLEITYANKGFLELIGCSQEQFDRNGHGSYLAYVHPEDLPKMRAAINSNSKELSLELRVMRTDKSYIPALFNCTVGETNSGEIELYCVILDMTDQNRLMDELRIESRRTELILERVDEVFYDVNIREGRISTSVSFAQKLGWELPSHVDELNGEVLDRMWHASPEDMAKLHSATKEMLESRKPVSTMMRIEAKPYGGYIWCEVMQHPILLENGDVASVIGLIRDIDKQVKEREQLVEQTRRDPLTGLYNKEAFEVLSSDALLQLPDKNHALIFIDLDHFKTLNDTLGHMTGDKAICEAADKLRIIFSNYDLVARFGGDEFCIFVKNIPMDTLRGKLEWMVDKLHSEYRGDNGTVKVTCSCGVACTLDSGFDYHVLMQNADKSLSPWAWNLKKGDWRKMETTP
ncbi:MAG: transporter substrate-binding domain-containing protein, partial [Methanocorpusculum sp.]|nr:transporter substrate-binding domain-containing protein [Methanocorpusculum sp.]